MSEFDEASSAVLEKYAVECQEQAPKIVDAIKNLVSVVLGKQMTQTSFDAESAVLYTSQQALLCAKLLAKSIQQVALTEYSIWSSLYPQTSSQTADDRLTQLLRYKTLVYLRQKVLRANQSICKFFGVNYFLWSNCDLETGLLDYMQQCDAVLGPNESTGAKLTGNRVTLSMITDFVQQFLRTIRSSECFVLLFD